MDIFTIIMIILYLFITGYLGYRGYKGTNSAADYMVAGRKTHPVIMALSYGATFISTSAIVGFGGVAAGYGMGLLWLVFLNIFLGIFIAFVVFGKRTRKIGHRLDAHTFPELLGRRFKSRFIQGFSGLLILIFMPLYAGVVIIGASKFINIQFHISYEMALLIFVTIVAIYVIMGGIKGVMYTDALQGLIMIVGMVILLVYAYIEFGGIISTHEKLTALAPQAQEILGKKGVTGFTAFPTGGSETWWMLVSTIIMGVGIGVLAQPQLAVRFMTVKSNKEINRGVIVGGIFILMMVGVAYTVGPISNLFFYEKGVKIMTPVGEELAKAAGGEIIVGENGEKRAKKLITAKASNITVQEKAIAVAKTEEEIQKIKKDKKATVDDYIPLYIENFMPSWFAVLFLLTLISAAMSTLSSQFHVMGTSAGRDIYESALLRGKGKTLIVTKTAVLITILFSTLIAYALPKLFGQEAEAIIARGTSLFFGLCTATFFPVYCGALFFKSLSKKAAITGMLAGFVVSLFWLVCVHAKEAEPILKILGATPIGSSLTDGKVVANTINNVDPLFIGLPASILVTYVANLFMKVSKEELEYAEKVIS